MQVIQPFLDLGLPARRCCCMVGFDIADVAVNRRSEAMIIDGSPETPLILQGKCNLFCKDYSIPCCIANRSGDVLMSR